MTQLVSIQQAARNALALWIASELNELEGLVVEPTWFESNRKLPPIAISIIGAGRRDIAWGQPELVASAPSGPNHVFGTYKLGYLTQRVQLDIQTTFEPVLQDVIARLDESLNKGAKGLGVVNCDPFANGILVPMLDGWEPGTADFLFGEVDENPTPASVMQGEWRAMYRGELNAMLVGKATSPKLARVNMMQRLRVTDAVDQTAPYDVTTITATGETHSTDP